jgi:hypothetical protein
MTGIPVLPNTQLRYDRQGLAGEPKDAIHWSRPGCRLTSARQISGLGDFAT